MNRTTSRVALGGICLVLFVAISSLLHAQPRTAAPSRASDDLIALGKRFEGSMSCKGAECHSAPDRKKHGHSYSNENTLWSGGMDPHASKAWDDLSNDKGKEIVGKYKPGAGDGTTDADCLSCHALSVPKALQGNNYNLKEGVTCDACHGPSSGYLMPHQTVGWYDKTKGLIHSEGLLKEFGLWDTLNVRFRAERCTRCHLQIDAKQVAAGHPQPGFELNYYSVSYPDRHWEEEEANFAHAQLWLVGQQVELREALRQLATRAGGGAGAAEIKGARDQAMAHYAVFRQAFAAGLVPGGVAALDGAVRPVQQAGNDNAKLAAAAANAAKAVDGMHAAVDAVKPQQPSVVALMQAMAKDKTIAGTYGQRGQEQQVYAIYAMYGAYAGTLKPANGDAVKSAIIDKLLPDKPLDPPAFVAALADIQKQLPAR